MKIDFFGRGYDPFDDSEFSRRRSVVVLASGETIVVKSPEDTVLRKLLWFREGGEGHRTSTSRRCSNERVQREARNCRSAEWRTRGAREWESCRRPTSARPTRSSSTILISTGQPVRLRSGIVSRVGSPNDPRAERIAALGLRVVCTNFATARSLRAMLQRPAERLIVGHGDIIEQGCRDQLAHSWLEGVAVGIPRLRLR